MAGSQALRAVLQRGRCRLPSDSTSRCERRKGALRRPPPDTSPRSNRAADERDSWNGPTTIATPAVRGCVRATGPWVCTPRRVARHAAMVGLAASTSASPRPATCCGNWPRRVDDQAGCAEALGRAVAADERAVETVPSPAPTNLEATAAACRCAPPRSKAAAASSPTVPPRPAKVKLATGTAETRDKADRPVRDPGRSPYNAAVESAASSRGHRPAAGRFRPTCPSRGATGFATAAVVVIGDGAPWIWNGRRRAVSCAIESLTSHAKRHLCDVAPSTASGPTCPTGGPGPPCRTRRRPAVPVVAALRIHVEHARSAKSFPARGLLRPTPGRCTLEPVPPASCAPPQAAAAPDVAPTPDQRLRCCILSGRFTRRAGTPASTDVVTLLPQQTDQRPQQLRQPLPITTRLQRDQRRHQIAARQIGIPDAGPRPAESTAATADTAPAPHRPMRSVRIRPPPRSTAVGRCR